MDAPDSSSPHDRRPASPRLRPLGTEGSRSKTGGFRTKSEGLRSRKSEGMKARSRQVGEGSRGVADEITTMSELLKITGNT